MATKEETPPPKVECIIHCSDDQGNLVSSNNADSWKALLRAAQIRQYAPVLDLAKDIPEGQMPAAVYYHRNCRSVFTMKKDLDRILQKEKPISSAAEEEKKRTARCATSTSRTYTTECIFCQKTSKYLKGQNRREALIQCSQLRADAKIRSAAQKKMDSRILAIVSRDLVAAEGHYHTSCYKIYTKEVSKEEVVNIEDDGDSADAQYEAAVKQSYNELFLFIRTEIFGNPCVITMPSLTSRLVSSIKSQGIVKTTKHIRRKLESEFAGVLHIISNANGKLPLFPDNLSMDELVKENQSLKSELQTLKSASAQDVVANTAFKLREDIKDQEVPQAWPPDVKPEAECAVIPESLRDFLCHLLSGTNYYKQFLFL